MSMRVWWVLRGLSGSCFFSSCFYLFSLFHVFLKCHRRPSRQAPGRRANSSWLEERLICILVSRTRSEAVQSLVHWDWLCLPFSFCGRQTMRGQRERGREIIRFQQAQFWERTKLASTVCVCVLCVFMWVHVRVSLSTSMRWCVRSVGVCATHWSGRRVHGGMEAVRWMLCVMSSGEMQRAQCVYVCGGIYEWAAHRLVSDLYPVWIAIGLVLSVFISVGGQRDFRCADITFIVFTH